MSAFSDTSVHPIAKNVSRETWEQTDKRRVLRAPELPHQKRARQGQEAGRMVQDGERFASELAELRERLLQMGTLVEELVRDSITTLVTQDMALASTIIPRDDSVDRMDVEIEALCLRLMARQMPLDADARLVSAVLKVITDVERIGDHAVDITRIAERMEREMVYKPLVDIPRMGKMACAMLHDTLEAFVRRDAALALHVVASDDAVDALYGRMRIDLQAVMLQDPHSVLQASYLLFVAHYLERICDHCTNIAERVAFIETGRLKNTPQNAPN